MYKMKVQNYLKKNQDYGDAFAEFGVIGVLVRIGDKIKKITIN